MKSSLSKMIVCNVLLTKIVHIDSLKSLIEICYFSINTCIFERKVCDNNIRAEFASKGAQLVGASCP